MTSIILDLESNGLIDTATEIWCICIKDITCNDDKNHQFIWCPHAELTHSETRTIFTDPVKMLEPFNEIIGHNIIAYDIPLLDKLLNLGWYDELGTYVGPKLIDTLVMSRVLYPDRPGGHSLEAHMKRLGGEQKVQQEYWNTFDPNMITRCESDVNGTLNLYKELLNEINRTAT